jgi:hypothetical protein
MEGGLLWEGSGSLVLCREVSTSIPRPWEDCIWKVVGKHRRALALEGDWLPSCWGFALGQWWRKGRDYRREQRALQPIILQEGWVPGAMATVSRDSFVL